MQEPGRKSKIGALDIASEKILAFGFSRKATVKDFIRFQKKVSNL